MDLGRRCFLRHQASHQLRRYRRMGASVVQRSALQRPPEDGDGRRCRQCPAPHRIDRRRRRTHPPSAGMISRPVEDKGGRRRRPSRRTRRSASLRKNASLPRAPSATRPGGSRPRSRIRAVDVDAASSLRGALVHLLELGRHDALAAPRGIFVPRSRDTRHHCRNCRLPLSPSYSPRASAFLGRLVLSW